MRCARSECAELSRRVPATAWLLACARHRRHVLGARWLPSQPPALHAFLRLGWPETSACWPAPPTPELLLAWGGGQLQHGLRGHLPDYLQPTRLLKLTALPRMANGKIDRVKVAEQALRAIRRSQSRARTPGRA